jgi:hypothetical protein
LSLFQICLYFLIGYLGTKLKQTIYVMVAFTCINIMGTVVLITVAPTASTRGGLLVAFYLMQSFQAVNPSMYAKLSRNVAGQTKKSIVYALFFVGWAGGNAVGPQSTLFPAAATGADKDSLPEGLGNPILQLALHPPRPLRRVHHRHPHHAPYPVQAEREP